MKCLIRIRFYYKLRRASKKKPVARHAGHFGENIFVGRSRFFEDLVAVICGVDQVKRCSLAETFDRRFEQIERRKFIACPRKKEHRNINICEVLGAFCVRPSGEM